MLFFTNINLMLLFHTELKNVLIPTVESFLHVPPKDIGSTVVLNVGTMPLIKLAIREKSPRKKVLIDTPFQCSGIFIFYIIEFIFFHIRIFFIFKRFLYQNTGTVKSLSACKTLIFLFQSVSLPQPP